MWTLRLSLVGVATLTLLFMPSAVVAQDKGGDGLEFLPTGDPAVAEVLSRPHDQRGNPDEPDEYRALAGARSGYSQIAVGPDGGLRVYDGRCGAAPEDCTYEAGEAMVCREPRGVRRGPSMDSCIWQAGVPGRHGVPYGLNDLAVSPDGRLWATTAEGLASFDGKDWTMHWQNQTDGGLVGLTVAPDGSVVAVGQQVELRQDDEAIQLLAEMIVIRTDGDRVRIEGLGAPTARGQWRVTPNAIVVAPDDSVWIGGISPLSGADTFAEEWGQYATRGFLARYDGEALEMMEPLAAARTDQPGVAALAIGPDGSVWALLWRMSSEGSPEPLLARYDGQDWTSTPIDAELPGRPGDSLALDSAGTVWLTLELGLDAGGLASLDGDVWTTYLPGSQPWEMRVAPDDTVWWTNASIAPEWGVEDSSRVGIHAIRPGAAGRPATD